MSSKAVALSARISQEDADFLAGLVIEGATTPSDKLRAIIAEARDHHRGEYDYAAALKYSQTLFAPAQRALREAAHKEGRQSQLLERVQQWLPEMVALVQSQTHFSDNESTVTLVDYERELAERIFSLIESVLQLGITEWSNCYAAETLKERLEPVLLLASVLSDRSERKIKN